MIVLPRTRDIDSRPAIIYPKRLLTWKDILSTAILLALLFPYSILFIIPAGGYLYWRYSKYEWIKKTFGQVKKKAELYARIFKNENMLYGDFVLVLVPPSFELVAVIVALVEYIGAVPVFANPLIGIRWFVDTVSSLDCKVVVAPWFLIPFIKVLFSFAPIELKIIQSSNFQFSQFRSADDDLKDNEAVDPVDDAVKLDDTALLMFTSGSTGHPKGVFVTKRMLTTQIKTIHEIIPDPFTAENEGKAILVCLTYWLLMTAMLGKTSIIPPGNLTRPSTLSTNDIMKTLAEFKDVLCGIFASPVTFRRISESETATIPSYIKFCCTGGTYLSYPVARSLKSKLIGGDQQFYIIYGATEALPISCITLDELLSTDVYDLSMKGHGICAGRVVNSVSVLTSSILTSAGNNRDDRSDRVTEIRESKSFKDAGEFVYKGDIVSPQYLDQPRKEYHFSGDVGFVDHNNRLWYCGRLKDARVTGQQLVFSVSIEVIADEFLNGRARSAFCALDARKLGRKIDGSPVGVLVLEMDPVDRETIVRIKSALRKADLDKFVLKILPYSRPFPTDATHQSKIRRDLILRSVRYLIC